MKKRTIAMLLSLAMMLSLAACGGGSSSTPSGSNPSSNASSSGGAQDAGEFNPDEAADAMTIDELCAANGTEVGVDGIGEAYESIRNGGLSATIDSFPFYMGQIATEVTLRSLNGETIPSVVQTPQALIDATNVDTDAAEIINWVAPTYKAG